MKETSPLKWPSGWPRVMPEHRQEQKQWKKPQGFYVDQLELELRRLGAIQSGLTMNERGNRDTGVAVWFSRKREEDFSWRDTLGITVAYPAISDVESAYRKLAAKYHTDNIDTGDLEVWLKIQKARVTAREWVNRQEGNVFDYSIGADTFKEQRLNIAALANSLRHIRGLERCGTSAIMEKTIEGYKALPEGKDVIAATA